MDGSETKVGAFEAKTRLSELLRETERGSSFLIVRRSKPVARLVPVDAGPVGVDLADLRLAFRSLRKELRGRVDLKQLAKEGRRW